MTLFRQIIIAVLLLFIALCSGNLVVSVIAARTLVDEQMQVHARDTATSVALAVTQSAQDGDQAALETYFNAVSDSGFFEKITFNDLEGKLLLERTFVVKVAGVPAWFTHLIDLTPGSGSAEVSSDWVRIGVISVTSHPGQAYRQLWEVMLRQLLWFASITALACLLAYTALRLLMSPLARVEQQANAICNQEFPVQEKLPRTRELRQLAEAMNRMSSKLKQVFEHQLDLIGRLQLQSYRDPVTGLSNRSDFDNRLNSYVRDEIGRHSGALMIFAIADFARVNEVSGREEGNNLLKSFGSRLSRDASEFTGAIIARRQGTEFSVFVPDIAEDEADALAANLFQHLLTMDWSHQDQYPLTISMGFTHSDEILNGPELLSEADMALRQARAFGGSQWRKFSDIMPLEEAPVLSRPAMEWKAFIEECIDNGNIILQTQEIFSVPYKSSLGREVFTRFVEGDNQVSAGIIVPLAERFQLATRLDRLVLQQLVDRISADTGGYYSVNICHGSIRSEEFEHWLDDFLAKHKTFARKLVLEISEHALHVDQLRIRCLQEVLGRHGATLGVDHFGLESAAFGYLGSLPLHYIKVHRSFASKVDSSPDNQFYIRSLVQLAHSRDIKLITEGVETEAEWNTLCDLGVDCAQGFFLGRPAPV